MIFRQLLYIFLPILLSACTSVASSTLVYIVAKHSESLEKSNKQYTATQRCIIRGTPSPFAIAEEITYGSPITHKYHNVLNNYNDAPSDTPLPPHHVAYAFYSIADQIGDIRAKHRMEWLTPYFSHTEPEKIETAVTKRYKRSYLTKCFSVPIAYRRSKDPRNYIKRDQTN